MASMTGEIFVKAGLITREQLATAVEKQKQLQSHENIGDLLVDMGLITERDRVRCMGEHWGVAYIDLSQQPPDPDAVKLLAQDIARRFKAVPVSLNNGRLTLSLIHI